MSPTNLKKRPNIIFFTWHDAGAWFGCYGHETVNTPNVDRLAAGGARFTRNFSASAICSPSRAAMMTGKYCQRNGVMGLTNTIFSNRIHPHIPHLAKRLKGRGYRSAFFGVQHETAHEHVAEIMGFDEQFATDPWPNADITAQYADRWLRDQANQDGPFYMQVGTYDAHLNRFYSNEPARPDEAYPPVQDTEKGLNMPGYLMDNAVGRETVATLQGLLQRGDRLMGAILNALEETGQAENTLVVMCVDHGVGLPRAKATCYDPGLETAWIMRWPGVIPPQTQVNALTTHVDVLPTLWELLGHEPLDDLDGQSFAQHAQGQSRAELNHAVFGHMVETTRSIRTATHKLIRNFSPNGWRTPVTADCAVLHKLGGLKLADRPKFDPDIVPNSETPALELYDLQADPLETRNLAHDPAHTDLLAQLDMQLWEFLIKTGDFLIHQPIRTPWQAAIRQQLEQHCQKVGHPLHPAAGPLANAIDAATQRGTTN